MNAQNTAEIGLGILTFAFVLLVFLLGSRLVKLLQATRPDRLPFASLLFVGATFGTVVALVAYSANALGGTPLYRAAFTFLLGLASCLQAHAISAGDTNERRSEAP